MSTLVSNVISNLSSGAVAGPLLLTIPHSGEVVPTEVTWLNALPEKILMCDVDRYVDRIYEQALAQLKVLNVKTPWHRYVVDLNRVPLDIDPTTVEGAAGEPGLHRRGFHWSVTTKGDVLLQRPIPLAIHELLTKKYFEPFHEEVRRASQMIRSRYGVVYHLDLHSMPSIGTQEHRDPWQKRPQLCISDSKGKSAAPDFMKLVVEAMKGVGFEVGVNWPYFGGRITETYGRPDQDHHTVQIELRRDLYMDENSKQLLPDLLPALSARLSLALQRVLDVLKAQSHVLS